MVASRRSPSRTTTTENLVAIIELKHAGPTINAQRLDTVKHEVSMAIWRSHNLRVGDLVLVSPGSIPITTSGKIRRSSCAELYREGWVQAIGHRGMTSWGDTKPNCVTGWSTTSSPTSAAAPTRSTSTRR